MTKYTKGVDAKIVGRASTINGKAVWDQYDSKLIIEKKSLWKR